MARAGHRRDHSLLCRRSGVVVQRVYPCWGNFVDGLSRTLGMDTSLISIIALVIGLMLLYSAVRAFMRASIILGIIWLALGLWLLSWIIH